MGSCYNFNNNALVDVGGEKLSFYTRWNLATDRTTFLRESGPQTGNTVRWRDEHISSEFL